MKIIRGIPTIGDDMRIPGVEEKANYTLKRNISIWDFGRLLNEYLPRNERTDFNLLRDRT